MFKSDRFICNAHVHAAFHTEFHVSTDWQVLVFVYWCCYSFLKQMLLALLTPEIVAQQSRFNLISVYTLLTFD